MEIAITRYVELVSFLTAKSIARPVPNKRVPITMKRQASSSLHWLTALPPIVKDWNAVVKEVKDFAELARCYEDFASFQVASV